MLPDFPNWCASTGIGDAADVHHRRWNAIATCAVSAKVDTIETLLRLSFQTKQQPDGTMVIDIREAIRQADPPASLPNDYQLQVLAATALIIIMNAGGSLGARAALAVTTTAGFGRTAPDLPMDILGLAKVQLGIIANKLRNRTAIPLFESGPPIDLDPSATKLKDAGWTNNWQPAAEALASLTGPINDSLKVVVTAQNAMIRKLNGTLAMQDEELNMLWWLTNAYSNDLQMPFRDIVEQRRPLLYAKELADLTAFLPGPASAQALLSRAGLDGRPQTIAAAVNDSPMAWAQPLIGEKQPSPISTPVHFAMARAAETGSGNDWIGNWNAITQLDAHAPIKSLTLGTLFYRERLLMRPDQ